MLKSKSDRAFVMGFDVTPTVTQDWTNNIDGLETGVNRLRPGGGTALFDAVYTACRDKLLDVSRGQEPVRKAIILLSDGDDNQSRVYLDEAIKECQRAETIIYAISTNWTPSRGKGDKVLTQMAEDTGGQVFFPPSVEEVSNSFQSIEEELRSQYALTYTPADFKMDGAFRTIYLYCNDRRYQVRAQEGVLCAAAVRQQSPLQTGSQPGLCEESGVPIRRSFQFETALCSVSGQFRSRLFRIATSADSFPCGLTDLFLRTMKWESALEMCPMGLPERPRKSRVCPRPEETKGDDRIRHSCR